MSKLTSVLLGLAALASFVQSATAQTPAYAVGDKVELLANGDHWQSCVVTEPGSQYTVMFMECEPYSALGYQRAGGRYSALPTSPDVRRPRNAAPPPAPTGGQGGGMAYRAAPASARAAAPRASGPAPALRAPAPARTTAAASGALALGEYGCVGFGGRMINGLAFRLTGPNTYTDLDNARPGTYTISGSTISFRGGHLDGVTGRDIKGNHFILAQKAECEIWK